MTESIAHYRIGAKLGQGAMGAVYRATDTKLGRDVAIKLLTATGGDASAGLASVAREAKVLASLNHPNIAAIYGIEDHAIVMELVEGPTLADRIARAPLVLEEALDIARQIADALAAAHDKGIVHRDLKPGNVKLTPDGTIKLLDFGLATPAVAQSVADETMTMATTSSGVGVIAGTPAYMAPEQARGGVVDKRADIWAFGVVLYEMLTGSRLFGGDSTTDVIAAVVREDPDLSRVPASVRPLLRRCLEKDPKRRLRDIGDAMLILESAAPPAATAAPAVPTRVRSLWPLATAGVVAAALAALAFVHFREIATVPQVVRFSTTLPANVTFTQNTPFAFSPDGRMLAFTAIGTDGGPRLWIRSIDVLTPRPLAGVDVTPNVDTLFWSPDSRSLAFTMNQQLKRVDVAGGPVQTIAQFQRPVRSGTWLPDGTILLGSFDGILRVPATGGTPAALTKAAGRNEVHTEPVPLPDGRHFLYSRGGPLGMRAVLVGSLDAKPEEQPQTPVIMTDYAATFVGDGTSRSSSKGWLLFVRDAALVAQPFDAASLKLSGEPTPIVDQLGLLVGTNVGAALYSVSSTGALAYEPAGGIRGMRQLQWLDRAGRPGGVSSELALYGVVKVSPDGTRVATSRTDPKDFSRADLWITNIARDASIRLTFSDGVVYQAVWSPDSMTVAYLLLHPTSSQLYRKAADGSGRDELLYTFTGGSQPSLTDWTADGRFLVYSQKGDIFALPVGRDSDGSRQPVPVIQSPANEVAPYISPDSKWVAYMSNESGRQEIYVQPFAPTADGVSARPAGGKTLISRGALGMPRWRGDGKELAYLGTDGTLMSVEVTLMPTFAASAPRPLFQLPREFLLQTQTPGGIADLSRDHQRLYLSNVPPDLTRREIDVILNWQAAGRR